LAGKRYQPLVPTAEGWYWSEVLELFLGIVGGRLRYLSATGVLIPTLEEAAQQGIQQAVAAMNLATIERQRANTEQQRADAEQQRADTAQQQADAERQRADAEQQRADQLAQRLRQLGIDPDRNESTP
jgi:hypothetical protein